MPLPADRRALERGLRVAALALLGWLIVLALLPAQVGGRVTVVPDDLDRIGSGWGWRPPAESLSVALDAAPSPLARDWLVALRRTGTTVMWSNVGVAPIVLEVEPKRDPAGGVLARLAGPPGTMASLADGLGPLDSTAIGDVGGATVRLAPIVGAVHASVGGTTAWASSDTADTHRRVLLLGAAGWEARFVARALEERGWVVDARYAVAPRIDVTQGELVFPDTASHAAVVVLDSTASRYAGAIVGFVRSGGGLVMAGDAGASLDRLAPGGTAGPTRHATAITFEPDDPRRALSYVELRPLSPEAVTLESRDGRPVVAARRVGAGRVIGVGYRDTWRWRMQGGEGAVAAHRAWWADLVAGVVYAPLTAGHAGNVAPLASLVDALGPPASLAPARPLQAPLYPWLVAALMLCLLLEWASRRLRGAR